MKTYMKIVGIRLRTKREGWLGNKRVPCSQLSRLVDNRFKVGKRAVK